MKHATILAGLVLSVATGAQGQDTVRRDGATSCKGPIILIDGVLQPCMDIDNRFRMNGLKNEDIASVEVLKGAAATAQYGAVGSTGVVAVTTKGGKAGNAKTAEDPLARYLYSSGTGDGESGSCQPHGPSTLCNPGCRQGGSGEVH